MSIKFKSSFFSLSSFWIVPSFSFRCSSSYVSLRMSHGGGFSHWRGIRICVSLFRCYFVIFGMFSSEMKEPELHELGVFWANYGKKHQIWAELGAFLSKLVYWRVDNCVKLVQRSKVWHVNPRKLLAKVPPPGRQKAHIPNFPVMCIWWMIVVSPYLPGTKSVVGWEVGD